MPFCKIKRLAGLGSGATRPGKTAAIRYRRDAALDPNDPELGCKELISGKLEPDVNNGRRGEVSSVDRFLAFSSSPSK
jgi:hypothetical protein